jgi:hypothetical protein
MLDEEVDRLYLFLVLLVGREAELTGEGLEVRYREDDVDGVGGDPAIASAGAGDRGDASGGRCTSAGGWRAGNEGADQRHPHGDEGKPRAALGATRACPTEKASGTAARNGGHSGGDHKQHGWSASKDNHHPGRDASEFNVSGHGLESDRARPIGRLAANPWGLKRRHEGAQWLTRVRVYDCVTHGAAPSGPQTVLTKLIINGNQREAISDSGREGCAVAPESEGGWRDLAYGGHGQAPEGSAKSRSGPGRSHSLIIGQGTSTSPETRVQHWQELNDRAVLIRPSYGRQNDRKQRRATKCWAMLFQVTRVLFGKAPGQGVGPLSIPPTGRLTVTGRRRV